MGLGGRREGTAGREEDALTRVGLRSEEWRRVGNGCGCGCGAGEGVSLGTDVFTNVGWGEDGLAKTGIILGRSS